MIPDQNHSPTPLPARLVEPMARVQRALEEMQQRREERELADMPKPAVAVSPFLADLEDDEPRYQVARGLSDVAVSDLPGYLDPVERATAKALYPPGFWDNVPMIELDWADPF